MREFTTRKTFEYSQIRSLRSLEALNEVRQNIINPKRLVIAEKQFAERGEEKYDCWFDYSKALAHRYVIILTKSQVRVVTVIKVRKKWQEKVERYAIRF